MYVIFRGSVLRWRDGNFNRISIVYHHEEKKWSYNTVGTTVQVYKWVYQKNRSFYFFSALFPLFSNSMLWLNVFTMYPRNDGTIWNRLYYLYDVFLYHGYINKIYTYIIAILIYLHNIVTICLKYMISICVIFDQNRLLYVMVN